MSKFLFVILLLANAALFAAHQGYFDAGLPNGREPARLLNQLNADKLTLVSERTAMKLAPAVASSGTNANGATSASPAAPEAVAAVGPAPNSETQDLAGNSRQNPGEVIACTEVGDFEPVDARRFEARLGSLALGDRLARRAVPDLRHIVYIPPTGAKEAADKKASELRRLGITDFFVIQDNSPLRWGISLGIFKTEESARAHLTNLSQRGVRSARLGVQNTTSNKVAFRLLQLDPAAKSALDLIKADFSAQQLRACEAERSTTPQ